MNWRRLLDLLLLVQPTYFPLKDGLNIEKNAMI